MKFKFCVKDINLSDFVAKELEKRLRETESDEDKVLDAVDAFKKKFRYGEYVDMIYDTETDSIGVVN